jgi:hypothetical protein
MNRKTLSIHVPGTGANYHKSEGSDTLLAHI